MSLNVLKVDGYRGEFSKWAVVSVLLIAVLAANSFAQMLSVASRQTTPFAVASSLPAKPVLLASLRPAPGIVWQRVKTDDRPLDGPVLYQIIFRSSATPGHVPRIANNFTLTNSLISDNGTQVAIGGLAINGNTGIISFANGQTFPGTGGGNHLPSGKKLHYHRGPRGKSHSCPEHRNYRRTLPAARRRHHVRHDYLRQRPDVSRNGNGDQRSHGSWTKRRTDYRRRHHQHYEWRRDQCHAGQSFGNHQYAGRIRTGRRKRPTVRRDALIEHCQ